MNFKCKCGTRHADTFTEIIDGVYICGWCGDCFDDCGFSVERPVVHDQEDEQIPDELTTLRL